MKWRVKARGREVTDVKVVVYEKKIVIKAEKDETLSLEEVGNGNIVVQSIRTQKSK